MGNNLGNKLEVGKEVKSLVTTILARFLACEMSQTSCRSMIIECAETN